MTDTTNQDVTETAVPQKLTSEQEINALRSVHAFLSTFDRIPGSVAATFGQALDTIAVVANSLIAKRAEETGETVTAEAADVSAAQ